MGKPEGKRPLERRNGCWEDNIKMYLTIELEGVDWVNVAHDKVQMVLCEHVDEPLGSIKCRQFLDELLHTDCAPLS